MSSSSSVKDLDRVISKDNTPANVDAKKPNETAKPVSPELAQDGQQRMEGTMGDAILRFLRIRKGPKNDVYDLDAVGFKPVNGSNSMLMQQDCYSIEYMGLRELGGVQRTIHPS